MHAAHDLADLAAFAQRLVFGAQRVVEHDDAPGAALLLHQRFHLRVIDALDLGVVVEIGDLRVVPDETETLAVELEPVGERPAVGQGHAVRFRAAAADTGVAPARLGDQRYRHRLTGDEIVELGLDRGGDDFGFRERIHR